MREREREREERERERVTTETSVVAAFNIPCKYCLTKLFDVDAFGERCPADFGLRA